MSKVLASIAAVLLTACSAGAAGTRPVGGGGGDGGGEPSSGGGDGDGDGDGGDGSSAISVGSSGTGGDNCSAAAKVIYLVSVQNDLWSFDPEIAGTSAYTRIGALNCPSSSSPQSMSVDRFGTAYVFYSDGNLFRVSTTDASCQATSYVHPVEQDFNQLGMGFTATAPDVFAENLYVVSPDFGLARVDVGSFAITETGSLLEAAELTGGPDGKLFHFAANSAALSEIPLPATTTSVLHAFNGLAGAQAWAFSRYAGVFYMFTAETSGVGSTNTAFDPVTGAESTRDFDVGFTVVGAGQSICVPPPPNPN